MIHCHTSYISFSRFYFFLFVFIYLLRRTILSTAFIPFRRCAIFVTDIGVAAAAAAAIAIAVSTVAQKFDRKSMRQSAQPSFHCKNFITHINSNLQILIQYDAIHWNFIIRMFAHKNVSFRKTGYFFSRDELFRINEEKNGTKVEGSVVDVKEVIEERESD